MEWLRFASSPRAGHIFLQPTRSDSVLLETILTTGWRVLTAQARFFPAWAYPTFAETLQRILKAPRTAQLLLISQELGWA